MSRKVLLTIGIVLVSFVGLGAYLQRAPAPEGPELGATAAAQLAFPGSVVFESYETSYLDRSSHQQIVGTTSTDTEVVDFYDARLGDMGFIDGAGMFGVSTTAETFACSWHGDGLVVRVSFLPLDDAAERYPEVAAAGDAIATVYRVLVIRIARDNPPKSCPHMN